MMQTAMTPTALDLRLVEATTGEDAATFLRDMLPIFLEDMPMQLAQLRVALSEGDLPAAERTAHAMKSSSAWIGATELSDACRQLERAAGDRAVARLEPLFQRVVLDYTRVVMWVQQEGFV